MTTTTPSGASASNFTYDGDGNRLSQTTGVNTTQLRWDVNASLPLLADERDGIGTLQRSYLHGNDTLAIDTAGVTSYLHHDALGSVVASTTTTGQGGYRYDYEPYGATRHEDELTQGAAKSPLRFTDQLLDDTGDYHLRARQYDPALGIFASRDPLAPESGGAQGSTYAYVDNRPAVFVDPDGLGKAWPGRPYPGSAGGVLQGLAYANCFGEGLARGTSCRASALGRILRSDPNSARRSAAGKRLPGVGRLAKGPIRWLGRGALPVGIGLDATDNFSEGRTPGYAAGRTVAQGLGGLAGGLAGGLICAAPALASGGLGGGICVGSVGGTRRWRELVCGSGLRHRDWSSLVARVRLASLRSLCPRGCVHRSTGSRCRLWQGADAALTPRLVGVESSRVACNGESGSSKQLCYGVSCRGSAIARLRE